MRAIALAVLASAVLLGCAHDSKPSSARRASVRAKAAVTARPAARPVVVAANAPGATPVAIAPPCIPGSGPVCNDIALGETLSALGQNGFQGPTAALLVHGAPEVLLDGAPSAPVAARE